MQYTLDIQCICIDMLRMAWWILPSLRLYIWFSWHPLPLAVRSAQSATPLWKEQIRCRRAQSRFIQDTDLAQHEHHHHTGHPPRQWHRHCFWQRRSKRIRWIRQERSGVARYTSKTIVACDSREKIQAVLTSSADLYWRILTLVVVTPNFKSVLVWMNLEASEAT